MCETEEHGIAGEYNNYSNISVKENPVKKHVKHETGQNIETALNLIVILIFLIELYKLDLYNFKIKRLIQILYEKINPGNFIQSGILNKRMLLIALELLTEINANPAKVPDIFDKDDVSDIEILCKNLRNSIINNKSEAETYINSNKIHNYQLNSDWIIYLLLYIGNYFPENNEVKVIDYPGPDSYLFNTIKQLLDCEQVYFNKYLGLKEGLAGLGLKIILNNGHYD